VGANYQRDSGNDAEMLNQQSIAISFNQFPQSINVKRSSKIPMPEFHQNMQ
jgi:hypothetical protein